jgi:hypothetical protein
MVGMAIIACLVRGRIRRKYEIPVSLLLVVTFVVADVVV